LAWASQGEAPPRRRAGDAADVAASAARAVGLLAQAAEFHRGSRVEDYGPLVAAATRVCARLAPARAPPDAAAALTRPRLGPRRGNPRTAAWGRRRSR